MSWQYNNFTGPRHPTILSLDELLTFSISTFITQFSDSVVTSVHATYIHHSSFETASGKDSALIRSIVIGSFGTIFVTSVVLFMTVPTILQPTAHPQLHEAKARRLESSLAQEHSETITNIVSDARRNATTVVRQDTQVAKPWAHFVAGGAGGMTSAVLTSPLDVLKTRLQSDFYQTQILASRVARGIASPASLSLGQSALLHFRETFQILFSVHRVEGWRALFKGLGPNLIGVVPARAINFYTYGNGKRIISEQFNGGKEAAWVHLCAAASAGIVTGTATNPIWLVKTRLQLDKSHAEKTGSLLNRQYKNSLDCVMQTVRKEGIRGLYRGLSASYLGVSESTLQWVLYEQMKLYLRKRESRLLASGRDWTVWDQTVVWGGKLGAAGSAKLFAAVITYPHEVVRTRLRQAPLHDGRVKYTSLVQCFGTIWKEEGMSAFYGGLTPHLLRVVPSAAIMFGMYEFILPLFGTQA